jgi:hypothetical protein
MLKPYKIDKVGHSKKNDKQKEYQYQHLRWTIEISTWGGTSLVGGRMFLSATKVFPNASSCLPKHQQTN